ncbi:MAG: ABC transporter permease, partial [Oscillospiraceae bacterium]
MIGEFFSYCSENIDNIAKLFFQHIQLTALSVAVAILIGIPLGILISRYAKLNKPILGFANVVQAIPSMAVLGFLIPV